MKQTVRTGVTAHGTGIQHSKYVRVGCDLCLGSCNFTTSSRCNLELNAAIALTEEAERFLYEREKLVILKSELLTVESCGDTLNRINSRSRSRSSESRGAGRRLDCQGTDRGRARDEGSDSGGDMSPRSRERYARMTSRRFTSSADHARFRD